MRRILGFLAMIFLTSMLFAENVTCENDNGSCQFNEDGSYECLCSEDSFGEGTGVAGSSDSTGKVVTPTSEECLETVDEMCGLPEGASTCENPAGECVVMENGDYWCDCYDGSSSGAESVPGDPGDESCESSLDCREGFVCADGYCIGVDGENPVGEDPADETPECETLLEETCGTEAPDINEICSEEELDFCSDGLAIYFEKCEDEEIPAEMTEEIKNGTWNELGKDVAECCQGYSYNKEEMTTFIDCLKTNPCEECMEAYEEAVGEDYGDSGDSGNSGNSGSANKNDSTGEDGSKEAEDSKATSSSDSSDGCSLTLI